MSQFIRLGDSTDHGGKVITASKKVRMRGRFVARKGDAVWCPQHPGCRPNLITEGDPKANDNGIPLAREGHHAMCGCRLISSLG